MTARIRTAAVILAVVPLVVTACGGTTKSGTTDTPKASSSPAGNSAAGSTASNSAVGVTADTITLGYTQIDFDQLRKQLHVDLNYQNAQPVLQALTDDINAHGGINGRKLIVKVQSYLPVGAATADAVCVKFTEDQPVFAVLGGFSGPGAVDVNPCITTAHDTILIGGTWTAAQHRAAKAPWLQVNMTAERRAVGFAKALGAHGQLDKVQKIAVLGAADSKPYLTEIKQALEQHRGTQVVLDTTISGGDAGARTLLERAKASGATAVFYSGLDPSIYPALADYDFTYFFDDASKTEASLRDFQKNGGKLAIVSNGTYPLPYKDDPEMAKCLQIVQQRTNLTVKDPNTLPDSQPDWAQAVLAACSNLRLFEKVADAAGKNLTNASFLAAAQKLGKISLPGVRYGSLGPDKYDASNTTSIVKWDPHAHGGEGGWTPLGSPFQIS